MFRKHTNFALALSAAVLVGLSAHAIAADYTWSGASGGSWTTTTNWTPNADPNSTSSFAYINDGTSTVLLNNTSRTVGGLTLAAGNTLRPSAGGTFTLNINSGSGSTTIFNNAGTITSNQGGTFRLQFGTGGGGSVSGAVNSGIIEATNGSTLAMWPTSGSGLYLDNTNGTIRTVGASTLDFAPQGELTRIQGGSITNNALGTINIGRGFYLGQTGSGSAGAATALTNDGTLNYSILLGSSVPGNGSGVTLSGTSSFTNTGTATFTRSYNSGTTANSRTNLAVAATATFTNSGTINIVTAGEGASGTTEDNNGMRFSMSGSNTINNTGTINLESQSSKYTTDLFIGTASSTVTLSGTGGALVLKVGTGGSVAKVGISGSGTATLVNSAGHTIRGAGSVGLNTLGALTNNGTINADNATNALTLDPVSTTGTFTNNGNITASGAGGLVLANGNHVNSSSGTYTVDSGSSLRVSSGAVFTDNGTSTINGIVGGAGTITPGSGKTFTVSSTGSLAPGDGAIGTLTINGASTSATALSLSSGASLRFELNSTGPANFQSDLITLSNGAAGDVSFGGNVINFTDLSLGTLAIGSYQLFSSSVTGAYTGLTLSGTTITGGLSIGTGLENYASNLELVGNNIFLNVTAAVPEPGTWALLAVGSIVVFMAHRRRVRA